MSVIGELVVLVACARKGQPSMDKIFLLQDVLVEKTCELPFESKVENYNLFKTKVIHCLFKCKIRTKNLAFSTAKLMLLSK
jgi:hypothetical protein